MSDSSSRERALAVQAFDEWPPVLRALFDGTGLAGKEGFTACLVVADADAQGPLRTSLLSAGELYAPDSRSLAFALWPAARAARMLDAAARRGSGRAALTFVHEGAFYQVQLRVDALEVEEGGPLACFIASIDSADAQQVGYAKLTSGITFELQSQQRQAVIDRWQQQIERLRRAVASRSQANGGAASP